MKFIVLIFLFIIINLDATSFSQSKKTLKNIYKDNQISFYCSNPYELKIDKGTNKLLIINDAKYYTPRKQYTKSGKENVRAIRIEWEHVMPVPFIFSKYGQEKSPNLYVLYS